MKAREWFINEEKEFHEPHLKSGYATTWFRSDAVRVIEHSAYEKAIAALRSVHKCKASPQCPPCVHIVAKTLKDLGEIEGSDFPREEKK